MRLFNFYILFVGFLFAFESFEMVCSVKIEGYPLFMSKHKCLINVLSSFFISFESDSFSFSERFDRVGK